VPADPEWFHVTVYENPQRFIVDATRDGFGESPSGYVLELFPPCPQHLLQLEDVWLVRLVPGPVRDAIRREPPMGNARAMRFRLSRLSRFVISH
jgi:hypothetical protein